MVMGIVSDFDFDSELESLNTPKNIIGEVKDIQRGRGNNNETPNSLRKIIGENVVNEGRDATKVMTRAFGLSDSSLSAYTNGATSTATYQEPGFKDHIRKAKERISRKARHRLNLALDCITEEKLNDAKIRDIAGVAQAMSAVVRDFEPSIESSENKNPVQFILYAPRIVSEEIYEVKEITE